MASDFSMAAIDLGLNLVQEYLEFKVIYKIKSSCFPFFKYLWKKVHKGLAIIKK